MTMNNTSDLDEILDKLQVELFKCWDTWYTEDKNDGDYYKWTEVTARRKAETKAKLQKLIVEAVISELEWLISWDNPDTLDKVTIKDNISSNTTTSDGNYYRGNPIVLWGQHSNDWRCYSFWAALPRVNHWLNRCSHNSLGKDK
jgi:hypothetical protein